MFYVVCHRKSVASLKVKIFAGDADKLAETGLSEMSLDTVKTFAMDAKAAGFTL